MNFRLEDHSEEVLKAMNGAVLRGLEKCGLVAEGYAKKLVNSPGKRVQAICETVSRTR